MHKTHTHTHVHMCTYTHTHTHTHAHTHTHPHTHTHTLDITASTGRTQSLSRRSKQSKRERKKQEEEEKKSCLQEGLQYHVQLERITLRCMNLNPCACSYLIANAHICLFYDLYQIYQCPLTRLAMANINIGAGEKGTCDCVSNLKCCRTITDSYCRLIYLD